MVDLGAARIETLGCAEDVIRAHSGMPMAG
jgi:hypothetical protein